MRASKWQIYFGDSIARKEESANPFLDDGTDKQHGEKMSGQGVASHTFSRSGHRGIDKDMRPEWQTFLFEPNSMWMGKNSSV